MKLSHVMVDIETLGTSPESAVLSVGLVRFDPFTGEIGVRGKLGCSVQAQAHVGREIDPATLDWWLTQGPRAIEALTEGPIYREAEPFAESILDAIGEDSDVKLWAKSPSFDLAILRSMFEDSGVWWPWSFRREYDVRTVELVGKAQGWKQSLVEGVVKHCALGDALQQAHDVIDITGNHLQ